MSANSSTSAAQPNALPTLRHDAPDVAYAYVVTATPVRPRPIAEPLPPLRFKGASFVDWVIVIVCPCFAFAQVASKLGKKSFVPLIFAIGLVLFGGLLALNFLAFAGSKEAPSSSPYEDRVARISAQVLAWQVLAWFAEPVAKTIALAFIKPMDWYFVAYVITCWVLVALVLVLRRAYERRFPRVHVGCINVVCCSLLALWQMTNKVTADLDAERRAAARAATTEPDVLPGYDEQMGHTAFGRVTTPNPMASRTASGTRNRVAEACRVHGAPYWWFIPLSIEGCVGIFLLFFGLTLGDSDKVAGHWDW